MRFILFFSWITLGQTQGPVVVKEDSDAVLPCSLSTKENIETTVFDWKKDGQDVFFYNGRDFNSQLEGRVSHFNKELKNGNSSIKITETKVADSGNYTCIFPLLKPPQKFTIELVVEPVLKDRSGENPTASPKPYIEILPQTEDRALLQCEVTGASPEPKVEWRDSSRNILHAVETQRSITGGKYDLTIQANVTKSDTYTCVVKQEKIYHVVTSRTFVYICAASPEPYMKILPQTEDRAFLQCEVKGASPEPKVEWRDSSGNILHAVETQRSITGGKYDLTIQANVTKSDTYSCVVKQEKIHHVVTSRTFVYISVNNGWHEGLAVGLTVGVMFLAAVEALSLWCFPSLRYKVIDFLCRLPPQRQKVIQMDSGSLITESSNGSTN